MTLTTFSNGLQVSVHPDPLAPAVALNLHYDVGSYDEKPGRSGFAHLFEHLMFQGSSNVAPGAHLAQIEQVGGVCNATTSSDRTCYYETVPAGAFELALWLEADRLRSLDVSAENFEAQRKVVKEEKQQRYDNRPYGDLLELLLAQHFEATHPYGHTTIGSMADLDAAPLADVQTFFRHWYRPHNLRMTIVGQVDEQAALSLVDKHFGEIASTQASPHAVPGSGPHTGLRTVVHRDVPLPQVCISWLTPPASSADNTVLEIALGILGDGPASRLHRELVEDRPVAKEVGTSMLGHVRDSSIAFLRARPHDDVHPDALTDAVRTQIASFAEQGPTQRELERAKALYERDWLEGLSSVESRADAIAAGWMAYGTPEWVADHLQRVDAITAADVQRVVATYLGAEPSALHYLPLEQA